MNNRIARRLWLSALLLSACAAPSIRTSLEEAGEVQLPTQRHGNYYLVDALIDCQGPDPILLDTGAGTTVLSPHVAKQTGVSHRMDSVRNGGFLATGSIPCRVQSLEQVSHALGFQIEGILAQQVFKGMLLTYDFPAGEVRVRSGCSVDLSVARGRSICFLASLWFMSRCVIVSNYLIVRYGFSWSAM
ncbi:MAG: hypothetical protein ACI85K_002352 [Hyphomicrobiaceae bacterium]|jgi:hypothetical protein